MKIQKAHKLKNDCMIYTDKEKAEFLKFTRYVNILNIRDEF